MGEELHLLLGIQLLQDAQIRRPLPTPCRLLVLRQSQWLHADFPAESGLRLSLWFELRKMESKILFLVSFLSWRERGWKALERFSSMSSVSQLRVKLFSGAFSFLPAVSTLIFLLSFIVLNNFHLPFWNFWQTGLQRGDYIETIYFV